MDATVHRPRGPKKRACWLESNTNVVSWIYKTWWEGECGADNNGGAATGQRWVNTASSLAPTLISGTKKITIVKSTHGRPTQWNSQRQKSYLLPSEVKIIDRLVGEYFLFLHFLTNAMGTQLVWRSFKSNVFLLKYKLMPQNRSAHYNCPLW